MIAVSGPFMAYLVNERKVRVFNTETGQKCSIDRAHGIIVGLAWSDEIGQRGETFLAVLAEDGEITIGKVSSDEADDDDNELSFEVTSILSFPEVGRARAISWNQGGEIGGKKHLAVHGNASSDVFFVHCSSVISGKSSFINTSIQDIKSVCLMESGACWVVGRDGCMQRFEYSGSSYQLPTSLKLPIKHLDAVKVFELSEVTFFITLSNNVLTIFSLNRFESEITEISSIELEISVNELVFDNFTRTLLLFAHGQHDVILISLAKMKNPRIIPHNLNSRSSNVLDVIFNSKKCMKNEGSVDFSVLFYFSDSICCQGGSFELEFEGDSASSEYEEAESLPTENEESSNELTADHIDHIVTSFTENQNNSVNIDLDSLKYEIKLMIRESIKETLTEVIHEALNSGIRAGFKQISEDLMELTKNLIKSVDTGTETHSPNVTVIENNNDLTFTIKNLISQGQFGMALRKSAAAGNCRLLLEVCQKFEDPFAALDEEQFSQETLTQMFGLLCLDIDEDTEVKLDWLQEILIQIDFDSGIAESPQLSEQVDKLFDELKSLVNDSLVDGNLQKKMKTVMRLLRKFQMN